MKKKNYLIVVIITITINAMLSCNAYSQQWRPMPGGSLSDNVTAIITFGGYVWVGGLFTSAGSLPAQYIVRHDGVSWVNADTLPGVPFGFCVYNNELYALGGFAVDTVRYGVMKWNGNSWTPFARIGANVGNSYVKSAAVYNGKMIIGGRFLSVEGLQIGYLAAYDGSSWSGFSGTTSCSWQGQPSINDVYAANGYLYVGGSFSELCGSYAYCSAKWDGTNWYPINIGYGSSASKFSSASGSVHVSGMFASAGPATSQAVARDGGGNWISAGNGVKMSGLSAANYQGKLYVGGQKSLGGGDMVGNCGFWNGSSWVADNVGICATGNEVVSVLYSDQSTGTLYAGGDFGMSTGNAADFIAYKSETTLPVELTYFDCAEIDREIEIVWETATESNADYFSLSVMAGGDSGNVYDQNYSQFAILPAYGNSSQPRQYKTMYVPNRSGTHYFRLEQYDWDGVCSGIWHDAIAVGREYQMQYSSAAKTITCQTCTGEITAYSVDGKIIAVGRSPLRIPDSSVGLCIAVERKSSHSLRFLAY
ncbi:MAG: hypothetical protein KBC67_02180 [Candidatus Pacebacteria bacterium]|nr:hypothetical protein [Candidatus Paceibacterota bacterium]